MNREELIKEFSKTYFNDIDEVVEEVEKVIDKLYGKFKEFVKEEELTKIEVDTDFWKMVDDHVIGQL